MQGRLIKVIVGGLTLLLLGAMWQWLNANDFLTAQHLAELASRLARWRQAPWMFMLVMFIYAGALLVMLPLSLLVVGTGLLFGPTWGFGYALLGTLASSAVSYWVGRWLGRDALLHYGGRHLRGMSRYLSRRGIRTMIVINLLPLAPFTLTNMMAGAFHLKFRAYMIGSTLGIVPGLAALMLLSSQLEALLTAENRFELGLAVGGLALAVVAMWGLNRYAARRRQRRLRH
ncbi:VTT domain-containing protein [Vreelandella rituensis]|uniref:TVP38/TMEM64 family membrane protein n=1 Tax=Vreelandella rituensis TaxID=2282306 RepID=A0A368U8G4_9GAMM|nr:VTT domain-containing protein [Halomonas rituensis]RCV92717.1 DedA family protein [Halomonas rituensis]